MGWPGASKSAEGEEREGKEGDPSSTKGHQWRPNCNIASLPQRLGVQSKNADIQLHVHVCLIMVLHKAATYKAATVSALS
jgi:hypothetical protein